MSTWWRSLALRFRPSRVIRGASVKHVSVSRCVSARQYAGRGDAGPDGRRGRGRFARTIERQLEKNGAYHLVQRDGGDDQGAERVAERRESLGNGGPQPERESRLRDEARPTPFADLWRVVGE